MRILVIILLITLMSISAYAAHIFPDSELKDLYVVEVSRDEGKAWIRGGNGNEAEVFLGDTIGIKGGIVVEIDSASITVQIGNTKTKMLVVHGFRE